MSVARLAARALVLLGAGWLCASATTLAQDPKTPAPVVIEAGRFPAWDGTAATGGPFVALETYDPERHPHAAAPTANAEALDFRVARSEVPNGGAIEVTLLLGVGPAHIFESARLVRRDTGIWIEPFIRDNSGGHAVLAVGVMKTARVTITGLPPGRHALRMRAEPRWDYGTKPPRWVQPLLKAEVVVGD